MPGGAPPATSCIDDDGDDDDGVAGGAGRGATATLRCWRLRRRRPSEDERSFRTTTSSSVGRSPRAPSSLVPSLSPNPTGLPMRGDGGSEAGNTHCTMCSWAAGEEERRGKEEG